LIKTFKFYSSKKTYLVDTCIKVIEKETESKDEKLKLIFIENIEYRSLALNFSQ